MRHESHSYCEHNELTTSYCIGLGNSRTLTANKELEYNQAHGFITHKMVAVRNVERIQDLLNMLNLLSSIVICKYLIVGHRHK